MEFGEELRELRVRSGLSEDDAAQMVGLTRETYQDIEQRRYEVPEVQQVGMFVCLGMPLERAKEIAFHVRRRSLIEIAEDPILELAKARDAADPFVFRKDGCVHVSMRNGTSYQIEEERTDSADKVLRWIPHLAGKFWMTRKHFREFASDSLRHLALPVSPPGK